VPVCGEFYCLIDTICDISAAKAQTNCAELNKHGPGGWSYTLYPQNKPDKSHLWRIMYSNRNLHVFNTSLKQAKDRSSQCSAGALA
jgi:hypothetical protein